MEIVIFVALLLIVASVSINALLFWYIRGFIERSSLVFETTNDMLGSLDDFSAHLGHVHELPLFYGDETLAGLLQHSKEVVQEIKEYKEGFVFNEGEVLFDEDAKDETEEEKLLFHSGS